MPAEWIEETVWKDCVGFIRNPGAALALAQAQLVERRDDMRALDAERERLTAAAVGKEEERQRVLTLYRRGLIQLADVEEQMREIDADASEVAARVAVLESRRAGLDGLQAHLNNATAMLERLRGQVETLEASHDRETMRRAVELLVAGVTIESEGEGRSKQARVTVRYVFEEHAGDTTMSRRERSRDRG